MIEMDRAKADNAIANVLVPEGTGLTKEFVLEMAHLLAECAATIYTVDDYYEEVHGKRDNMAEAYHLLNPGFKLLWSCRPDCFYLHVAPIRVDAHDNIIPNGRATEIIPCTDISIHEEE